MKYCIIALVALFSFNTTFCQFLTNDQKAFLTKNSRTIVRDSLHNLPDWSSLLPHIKGKKLILIGEFNHGSKEIFELRNSLIKYLYQETGTKAILFESGIGELITADIDRDKLTPTEMTYGLFGSWRAKEFAELMGYAKSHDISIAGFDVQRTGGSFNRLLKSVAQKYGVDTVSTYNLESRFGMLKRELEYKKAIYDSLKIKTTSLINDYKKIKERFAAQITKDTSKDLLFTDITLANRINYLSYMLQFLRDKNWNRKWAARDSAMAGNTQWLVDHIYKDQPVIIIGHNFHIGKYNENEIVMGELLKTRFSKDMYAIGIFAGSGTYNDNTGKEVKLTPPDSTGLDIKQIISNLHGDVSFIDMPDKFSNGSDWLNQNIIINDTFIDLKNSNKLILSKTFDGLILLKKVSPPTVD